MVFGEIYKKSDLKLTFKRHPSEVGLNMWQKRILARKVIELSNPHFYKTVYVSTCILFYLVIKANKTIETNFEKEYVESIYKCIRDMWGFKVHTIWCLRHRIIAF